MSSSTPALPSIVLHPSSRSGRKGDPFTIDDLAHALRGMPRDAAFWVGTADGLRPVVGIAPTYVRQGTDGHEASTAGAYGLVLSLGGVSPPPRSTTEDRYRAVLQAIARGRTDASHGLAGTKAQAMAREALIEMGDDWTKRGAPISD